MCNEQFKKQPGFQCGHTFYKGKNDTNTLLLLQSRSRSHNLRESKIRVERYGKVSHSSEREREIREREPKTNKQTKQNKVVTSARSFSR